jgi:hypothetical protein
MHRVLRAGGTLIGTVAFIEPFHQQSYFHFSHLGVLAALEDARFEVVLLAPASDWHGLRALAELALFDSLPRVIRRAIVLPFELVADALSQLDRRRGRRDPDRADLDRTLLMPGGFRFVARSLT